jgi:3-oxoacyl-[acyl-carrier-protein] synthase III
VLTVREQPGYASQCLECTQLAVEKYAADHGLTIRELDLVATSGPFVEFPVELAARLGIPPERVAGPTRGSRRAHTAGPIAALKSARRSGQLDAARTALWVAVGAGITVGLALYRR